MDNIDAKEYEKESEEIIIRIEPKLKELITENSGAPNSFNF